MASSIDLRAERAKVWEQMKALQTSAEQENRSLSAEESQTWEKMEADLSEFTERIAKAEAVEERDREFTQPLNRFGPVADVNHQTEEESESRKATATPEYRKAFEKYFRYGREVLSDTERTVLQEGQQTEGRALSTTGASGGFTIPEGFLNRLWEAQKAYGGVRETRATVIRTESGNSMPMPLVDDTANKGAILAENTAVTEQDVTFTTKTLSAYKYTSKLVRVSIELLQDTGFDLENWLTTNLSTRIARITNEHFTTGTGTSQPQGVITAATVGKTGAAGQTTTIIYDDFIDLLHSVDPEYRRNAEWMGSDALIKAARKIKDTTNQPIWQQGMQVGEPDRLFGYPIVINQDMAVPAASAKTLAFGDFSYYLIRDVMDVSVRRLDERYADFGQVAFLAFSRHDGLFADPGGSPVKVYQHPAA